MEWLDQKVLRQLAEDIGQEMMPVVISVFIEEVGEQLAQLRPLYEQQDWPALWPSWSNPSAWRCSTGWAGGSC